MGAAFAVSVRIEMEKNVNEVGNIIFLFCFYEKFNSSRESRLVSFAGENGGDEISKIVVPFRVSSAG